MYARDCVPYDVKNARLETRTHTFVKYVHREIRMHGSKWALALIEFSSLDKAKKVTKNYRFSIFAYEVHNPWHKR